MCSIGSKIFVVDKDFFRQGETDSDENFLQLFCIFGLEKILIIVFFLHNFVDSRMVLAKFLKILSSFNLIWGKFSLILF